MVVALFVVEGDFGEMNRIQRRALDESFAGPAEASTVCGRRART